MEIERKWRMRQKPALPERTHRRVLQSYLCLLPEVRIRRYEDLMNPGCVSYDLTIKSEGTLAREEIIKELSAQEYEALLGMLGGRAPIVKDHRTYDYAGYTLEYSEVDPGTSTGFSYAEVEFPTVAEAEAFRAPDWFGTESTQDTLFRMKTYWKDTRLSGESEDESAKWR